MRRRGAQPKGGLRTPPRPHSTRTIASGFVIRWMGYTGVPRGYRVGHSLWTAPPPIPVVGSAPFRPFGIVSQTREIHAPPEAAGKINCKCNCSGNAPSTPSPETPTRPPSTHRLAVPLLSPMVINCPGLQRLATSCCVVESWTHPRPPCNPTNVPTSWLPSLEKVAFARRQGGKRVACVRATHVVMQVRYNDMNT